MSLLRGIEERAKGYVAISDVIQQLVQAVTSMFGGS